MNLPRAPLSEIQKVFRKRNQVFACVISGFPVDREKPGFSKLIEVHPAPTGASFNITAL